MELKTSEQWQTLCNVKVLDQKLLKLKLDSS